MMDKKEIKNKRLLLLRNSKKRLIKKGTEHNINDVRICAVCGKQLSRCIIGDTNRMYPYILAIADHYIINKKNIRYYLCKNINSCYSKVNK